MDFLSKVESSFQWFVKTRFGKKILDILYDTIVLILYISAIALLHKVSDTLVGKEATFFGVVQIGYIIDFGHILALILFFLEIVKEIIKAIKEIIWSGSMEQEGSL